jgi:hypothetical protein
MTATGEQSANWTRGATLVPVPIAKVNGDWTSVNNRLAQIVNGKVYCLHADTLEPAECAFSTAGSACWLESERGLFAAVGQAISRDGEPGGEYIVAAKVSDDRTVPCVDPRDLDQLGAFLGGGPPASCELSGYWSVLEPELSASNRTGRPLQHHCHLQVCTSSYPHPDGADLVGSAEGPVFCYSGRGAALNDRNGHEADERMLYIKGLPVHVVWGTVGGVTLEVIAAKRPGARHFPLPAIVRTDTPIVWRAFVPFVKIGSELSAVGGECF